MQITYDQIRAKMDEPFDMKLCGSEADIVMKAVNIGIDSHLEACFIPDRGDVFRFDDRGRLVCEVSPESLPVLLRRLMEVDDPDMEAWSLVTSILTILGFKNMDSACFWITNE